MSRWALVGVSVPFAGGKDAQAGRRRRDGAQLELGTKDTQQVASRGPKVLAISVGQYHFDQNPLKWAGEN